MLSGAAVPAGRSVDPQPGRDMTLKSWMVKLFRGLGWQLSPDGLVRLGARGGYIPAPPNNYRVYAPWTEPPFRLVYEEIRPWTLVSDDRCYILQQFARQCAHLSGDHAECGVYRGGTAMLAARTLREAGASDTLLHLFDTFQGMPDEAARDPGGHAPGDFDDTSLAAVQSRLREFPNIRFHPGLVPDSLSAVADRRFALVYLDLDLYQPTIEALRFFYQRMSAGAVIVGDDYGFPRYKDAAKRAFDEFFSGHPEPVIVLKTGQCVVIKH
jgi:O-methyltransferase